MTDIALIGISFAALYAGEDTFFKVSSILLCKASGVKGLTRQLFAPALMASIIRGFSASVVTIMMGTGMFFTKGTADDKGVVELKGSMIDPMMMAEAQIRELMIPISDDQYKLEMYTDYGDGEFKSMEIVFTRAE